MEGYYLYEMQIKNCHHWGHNVENDIGIGHPNVSKHMILFFLSQHEIFEKTPTDMLTKHGEKYPIVF